jgi:hypothetical protein
MLRKWTAVMALVLIGVLGLVSVVAAQTEPGAGPDNPLTPDGAWTKLAADGEYWYVFHDEGDGEAIEVDMQTVPHGAATFEIWTPENLRDWANEEEFDPVGVATRSCGCEPSDSVGKSNWRGSFLGGNDFFIVVKSQLDDTGYFTLGVKGEDVTLRTPAPVAMAAEETAMTEPEAVAAAAPADAPIVLAAKAGESPAYALPLSQALTQLQEGQHWYAPNYDSDKDYGAMDLLVYANPPGSVVATVRNQEQARLWAREGKNEHFGCCTDVFKDDERDEEDKLAFQRWMADDLPSGQYYIVVELAEGQTGPVVYHLEVTGEGVSPS